MPKDLPGKVKVIKLPDTQSGHSRHLNRSNRSRETAEYYPSGKKPKKFSPTKFMIGIAPQGTKRKKSGVLRDKIKRKGLRAFKETDPVGSDIPKSFHF